MQVLFVCNGNVARSQEAEAFFNEMQSKPGNKAISAGVNVKLGKPIDPLVIEAMSEAGYNLSSATRKLISESMVQESDVIVSFKPKAELPEYISKLENVRYWNVDDPQHQDITFHRRVRDEVKGRVSVLLDELSI